MPDDLRDLLARTIRNRVRLTLGPRATRMLEEGNPVILSGREADDAADAALAALAEHGLVVDRSGQTGDLHARLDAALRPAMLIGLDDPLGEERAGEWADWVLKTVLAVRDTELETARAALARVRYLAEDWATLPHGTYARAGKRVLAALDSPETPR